MEEKCDIGSLLDKPCHKKIIQDKLESKDYLILV